MFKKVIAINLEKIVAIRPPGKYLYHSLMVTDGDSYGIDSITNRKCQINYRTEEKPDDGHLIRVWCTPQSEYGENIVQVLKWQHITCEQEADGMRLLITRDELMANNTWGEAEEDMICMDVLNDFEEDEICNLALEETMPMDGNDEEEEEEEDEEGEEEEGEEEEEDNGEEEGEEEREGEIEEKREEEEKEED